MANKKCEHGRQRYVCKDCGGLGICEHSRERYVCKDCRGSGICEHGRQRHHCKDCGGASICEHDRVRTVCKDCGGAGICAHGKHRGSCGLCNGTSVYAQHTRGARIRNHANELTEARYRWLIAEPCAYCGSPAGGVDRVKNEFGYTTLNSVPCCAFCNYMKRMMPAPEFIARATAHAKAFLTHSATYEVFKSRWIQTRTSGPDLTTSVVTVDNSSYSRNSSTTESRA